MGRYGLPAADRNPGIANIRGKALGSTTPARKNENPWRGKENWPAGGKRSSGARGPAQAERTALSAEQAQAAPDLVLVNDGGSVPVADAMLVS
jgi:hypothetical protein